MTDRSGIRETIKTRHMGDAMTVSSDESYIRRALPRPDWNPPYPAHASKFGSDVHQPVISYFGLQGGQEHDIDAAIAHLRAFLKQSAVPDFVDHSFYIDQRGVRNEVLTAYWLSSHRYEQWLAKSEYEQWLKSDDRLIADIGVWHETIRVPVERLETISGKKQEFGIARAANNKGTEVREHAYWGAMRHRLEVSASDCLESPVKQLVDGKPDTMGRMIRIKPPVNTAIIKSGQDWTECTGAELDTYRGEVHPRLVEGMNFLRDNPVETGCFSCRFMTERGADSSARLATFGFAIFKSLEDLEAWSKTHPTHLAIFNSFHGMVKKHPEGRNLKLWHEVVVLDGDNPDFVYVNCHPETGLLRWFDEAKS
ncbi:phenylacetaldoxime dehydratase family protein [Tardiphaga alba]|uniref:Phenylacetaldoxime dehydratase family protein n=1 Tax=Tardiphaga alba TaxID=340268 RepID=A0ABX8AJD9_9BRAD|nr:phenylacetaldoxime dehydratase family protein [Tardiphaga alba]QUS41945.1 phenylacetaldoxime dehydratase family protein [Tardiphaga alba]